MTAAETCRQNRWKPGDILRGTESGSGWSHTHCIQITAVGLEGILARSVGQEETEWRMESNWVLHCREWRKVATAPLDDAPPKTEWFK